MREKTLADLGWPQVTAHLASRCHTPRGAEAAAALEPGGDPAAARERVEEVAEARLLWQLEAPMPFGGIHEIESFLARVEKGGDLNGPELVATGETVAGCAVLRRHLAARAGEAPRLSARIVPCLELAHVSGPIMDSFEEGGRLADHASAALGPMRRKVQHLHEELGRRARELLDDPGIAPYLQDRFYTQRDDRYVVPLRADARSRVKGIVHGTSQSGQTVFVEPDEVVDLNNRLKIAESDVAEEERRILAELSGYVREEVPAIRAALAAATVLDLIDGAARMAEAIEASAPEIVDEGDLVLRQARHPLMLLAGRDCVPNDLSLPAGSTLIVSGPNAGGKTVALKTAGLCALFARAGLHIPAGAGSRVPWYDPIETDIGDDQSLERNLSTFSAHVLNINEFLSDAGPRTLLLIDELAVGTDPDQGAALASAVLEALAARRAQAIVTTHYERLKALATHDARFLNASVGFDLERMAPTFRLHLGVPGSSGALLVARRLGLPGEIVGRAEALLGDRRTGIEELLTAAAEERRRLEVERAAAEAARREAERARRDAEVERREGRALREQLRKGAHDEAVAALRQARLELDRLRERVRGLEKGRPGAGDLDEARGRLDELSARVAGHAPAPPAPRGRPASAEELVPGAAVWVEKLGGRGQVVAVAEKGRVMVQVGSLKTACSVEDVRIDEGGRGNRRPETGNRKPEIRNVPESQRVSSEEAEEYAGARTPDTTLDLRGERVDEALAETDRFLDDALLAHRDVIFVIHGHGTGALRSALRDHLDMHAAVARWRPGTPREGGDGVTVVWLDI